MAKKFLKKYVLGEGYPWAMGTAEHKEIALSEQAFGFHPVVLLFPKELWDKQLPRYRLVLERIDETNKAFTRLETGAENADSESNPAVSSG